MAAPASRKETLSLRSAAPAEGNLDPAIVFRQFTDTSAFPVKCSNEASFKITRFRSSVGLINPVFKESSVAALLVSVSIQSIPLGMYRLWVDSKRLPTSYVPAFRTNVFDFDDGPASWVGCAFDNVHYHVPRECIEDIATDWGMGRIGRLRQAVIEEDLVLAQLTKNILPATAKHGTYSPLELDQFQLILAAHLLQRYSSTATPEAPFSGGLAPWQKRRATELLSENLNGKVRLSYLARECGLSVSHFARSFKTSFGTSSHKWLIERRVERAKGLLVQTTLPLIDVAEQSGFGDQASFTRTFHRVMGASPGRWRRDHHSR